MSPDQPPTWRRIYDEVERTVAPRVEDLVRSDTFRREVVRANQVRRSVRRRLGRVTSRAWHLINLPAGSDVSRLTSQLGALDREVRKLSLELEQRNRSTPDVADVAKEGGRGAGAEPEGPA